MKAYVAGPFFTQQQLENIERVEEICKNAGVSMFRPRKDAGTLGDKPSVQDMKRVFDKDVKAIDKCDVVVADCTYRDTGTSFEMGYAFAKKVPVIMYMATRKTKRKVNLMLASSCFAVCTTRPQLYCMLLAFQQSKAKAAKLAKEYMERLMDKGQGIE